MKPPFVIDTILPQGVTLLHSPPKSHMSWLSLNLSFAVASGGNALGKYAAKQGDVLYVNNDGDPEDLRDRLKALFPHEPRQRGVKFFFHWPLIGAGFEGQLRDYLDSRPFTRLVIIDELGDLLPGPLSYEAFSTFTDILGQICRKYHIAIVLMLTTTRLGPSIFAGGAVGIAGLVDACAELRLDHRDPAAAQLRQVGRRAEGTDIDLYWNETRKEWLA